MVRRWSELPLLAISGLSLLLKSNRILAHCEAGGGSRLQYHNPMTAKARSPIPCDLERDFKSFGITSSIEDLTAV